MNLNLQSEDSFTFSNQMYALYTSKVNKKYLTKPIRLTKFLSFQIEKVNKPSKHIFLIPKNTLNTYEHKLIILLSILNSDPANMQLE